MIEAVNVSKSFDNIKAVDSISLSIKEGEVFGLIGTNGAGKSTFLRMMAGVLKPDEGQITIDGLPVYENVEAKKNFFYISDEQFFYPNATAADMVNFYTSIYADFDRERFTDLSGRFELEAGRKIRTYSKGMKKQLSILLGICSNTKYMYCDETFDGLDPVMRQAVKSLFAGEIEDRDFTPIIASHNLRELEDICDHVGLLHKGGVILSKDLGELKGNIHKVQCVLKNAGDENIPDGNTTGVNTSNCTTSDVEKSLADKLDIINLERRGRLLTLTIRGEEDTIVNIIRDADPLFFEVLPLSLEEIFISETGVIGYDIKKLIF